MVTVVCACVVEVIYIYIYRPLCASSSLYRRCLCLCLQVQSTKLLITMGFFYGGLPRGHREPSAEQRAYETYHGHSETRDVVS